ncbi:MAG: hydrogen peroxide-inducible genes activator [Alphaproteobacteria bacterium]|nr:MAG: hydrogen peroxide-inducible genes activator [Alphaproteobacteria bacterium]
MRLPTLTQLRHLVILSETSHFGRAAEAAHITQSTMSASIKELELTLGQTLIERTKRQVQITPLGREVIARAKDILNETEDLVALVSAAQGVLTGTLRLGIIPTIGPFLLPRIWPILHRDYPDLKLELREEKTGQILNALTDGHLDAALMAFPYETNEFERLIFADDPFLVVLPKNHPLCEKERLTTRDLKKESLLLLDQGNCLRDHILSASGFREGALSQNMKATSLLTLVQMVGAGFGLTLLPKMAVDAGLLRGTGLQVRPLEAGKSSRRIGLAFRKSSPRKQDFETLSTLLRDELGTPLPPTRQAKKSKP